MTVGKRLDEIEARLGAATAGEWRADRSHDLWMEVRRGHGLNNRMVADCVSPADAYLIAHAPADLRDLKAVARAAAKIALARDIAMQTDCRLRDSKLFWDALAETMEAVAALDALDPDRD